MRNSSSSIHAARWFDPRSRRAGSWAFLLNRLSALGLTFYLGLHLAVLSKLARGTGAYDQFIAFAHLPLFKVGEMVLIAAAVLHGLNGIRLILHAFGVGLRNQKKLFLVVSLITVLTTALFGIHLFGG